MDGCLDIMLCFLTLDLSFVFYSFCSKDLLNFYLPFFIVKICDTWLNVLY